MVLLLFWCVILLVDDVVVEFEATVLENKRTGQRSLTIPKPVSYKLVPGETYIVLIMRKEVSN